MLNSTWWWPHFCLPPEDELRRGGLGGGSAGRPLLIVCLLLLSLNIILKTGSHRIRHTLHMRQVGWKHIFKKKKKNLTSSSSSSSAALFPVPPSASSSSSSSSPASLWQVYKMSLNTFLQRHYAVEVVNASSTIGYAISHPLHHLLHPLPHQHLPLLLLLHFPDLHFPHYPDKTVPLLICNSVSGRLMAVPELTWNCFKKKFCGQNREMKENLLRSHWLERPFHFRPPPQPPFFLWGPRRWHRIQYPF